VAGRAGFQRLVAEVRLAPVGIMLGLEMSRLARSNRAGHHLLEVGAWFGPLLGDLDGIDDPTDANDRLVLGLKNPSLSNTSFPGCLSAAPSAAPAIHDAAE